MAETPSRRSGRARGVGFAALGAVLLLGVAVVYASTARGFETLWLPLARTLLDADVTAASGRLDLRGRLEVRQLTVDGDAFDLELAHGVVVVSPLAIPPWRRPLVEELRLESGHLVLHEADAPEEAEEAAEEAGEGLPPRLRPIPVRVRHASLRDVVVEGRAVATPPDGDPEAPTAAAADAGARAAATDAAPSGHAPAAAPSGHTPAAEPAGSPADGEEADAGAVAEGGADPGPHGVGDARAELAVEPGDASVAAAATQPRTDADGETETQADGATARPQREAAPQPAAPAGEGAPGTPRWRVGVAQAQVRDVAPGSDGTLSLETRWRLPQRDGVARDGHLVLDVALREPLREDGTAEGVGAPVAFDGRVTLRAGPPEASPPVLEVRAVGRGDLDARGTMRLASLDVDARERGTALVALRASGTLDPFAGRADLEIEADADPVRPLLAWIPLPEPLAELVAPAEAALRARLAADPQSTDVDGSLRLDGIVEDPELPASLDLSGRLRLAADHLELEAATLRGLTADGREQDVVRVEGTVRTGRDAPTELRLSSDGLRVTPWLARFGAVLPPAYGPLPVEADLRLTLEQDRGRMQGDGVARILAEAHPDLADRDAVFRVGRLDLAWAPDALEMELDAEGPPSPGGEHGTLHLALERTTATPRPRLEIDARLTGLDATALVPRTPRDDADAGDEDALDDALDEDELDEEALEDALEEAVGEEDGPPASVGLAFTLPFDLEVTLDVEDSLLHTLPVQRLHGEGRIDAGRMELVADGEGFSGGVVEIDFARSLEDAQAHARWLLRTEGVELAPLIRAVAPGERRLVGVLDLETSGEGRAPEAEAGLLARGDGTMRFRLRGLTAEGLRVQQVAARRSGVKRFLTLRVDDAQGDFPIQEGSLRLAGVRVDGTVAHFLIDGVVSPEGVDLIVNPRLGPDVASGYGLTNVLFAPVSSLVALPFVVTVNGPLAAVGVGARPASPALLGDVVGLTAGALQGAARGAGALVGVGEPPEPGIDPSPPPVGAGEVEGVTPPPAPLPDAPAPPPTDAPASPPPAPSP